MNLLAEVCISLKKYVKAVTLFMRFSGVRFEPAIPKISFKERSSLTASLAEGGRRCCVPTALHSDLTQKLCIILIHLEAFDMIKVTHTLFKFYANLGKFMIIVCYLQPVVTMLRETEPLETFGIQLYEIGEAYLAKQRFEESLSILETLVNTDKYSMVRKNSTGKLVAILYLLFCRPRFGSVTRNVYFSLIAWRTVRRPTRP